MGLPAILNRTTFEVSRTAEFFDLKELQAQTGQPASNFASVALKELADNALDAAETAGISPELSIDVGMTADEIHLAINDNGSGIPAEIIERILNFQTRSSDKSAYRAPTRGAQGNALKTIIGLPSALWGADSTRPVTIDSQGMRHIIKAWIDPSGELQIDHRTARLTDDFTGTSVRVVLPAKGQDFFPATWAKAYALFNPHALVRFRLFKGDCYHAKSDNDGILNSYHSTVSFPEEWRKYIPTDPTSPHWYDADSLTKLIFCHIADARRGGHDLTLREFVRQFRGLSGTGKAKAVCDRLSTIARLSSFAESKELIPILLEAMKEGSKPPPPEVLGLVGEDHFRKCFDDWYGIKRFWYRKCAANIDGIPFTFEVAVARVEEDFGFFHGVNHSPTFADPFDGTMLSCSDIRSYGVQNFLSQCDASTVPPVYYESAPTVAAIHLVCPALHFLDRGKSKLNIPNAVASRIAEAMWKALKVLYEEAEQRRKDAAKSDRRMKAWEREREREANRQTLTVKDAVFEVLPAALAKATGGGTYPVSARTLYYQVRPLLQTYTAKELEYGYFSQELLTQYRDINGPIEGLYYDPRGILYEPHTGESIPLGTREVGGYDFPPWLYNKILYIEKKGLWPIIQAAKLAERFDMAVIAAEGYATEAASRLSHKF